MQEEMSIFVKVLKESTSKQVTVWKSNEGKKYIRKRFSGTAEIYSMIAQIEDEALPKIYRVKEDAGVVEVEMEYIDGLTLTEVLSQGTLSEKQVYRVMNELCRVVDLLHGIDIVYRDIKPDNIMITKENRVILLDFDSARKFKLYQVEDTKCLGTPGYAAPEQYGVCQTDDRADIYSLGIILNLMLTGKHPSEKILGGNWQRIVECCTNINPEKRFATGKELMRALGGTDRRKLKIVGGIICILLLITGVSIWGVRMQFSEQGKINEQETDSQYGKYVGCWANTEYATRGEEEEVEDYFVLWMYRCDSQTVVFDMVQFQGIDRENVYDCVGKKKSSDVYEFTYQTALGGDSGRGTLRLQNDKLYLNVAQTVQGDGSEINVCNLEYDGYLTRDRQDENVDVRDLSEMLDTPYAEAEIYLGAMPTDKLVKQGYIMYFFENYVIKVDSTTEKVRTIQCSLYEAGGFFRSSNEIQGIDFTRLKSDFTKKFGTPYSREEAARGQEILKYALERKSERYWMYVTFDLQGIAQEVFLEKQGDE